ncbi:MAG: sulfotransferase [Pseudomonadota bacterium]|nr:sulfotransferase [Pseudomonadota bacterium]
MQKDQERYEVQRVALDAQALMARACAEAGLDDYGDDAFVAPLCSLLDDAAREADFHPAGLASFQADVVRCLVNRLRMTADLRAHPEIEDEDVSDPIIVIGLPRSGTTKTQRMLSAAPDVQKLYLWRIVNPARFPGADGSRPAPRIAAASMGPNSDDKPELRSAHLMTAQQPEEDWALFDATFNDWVWCVLYAPLDTFYDRVSQRPALDNYRYVRRVLQYLQWQDGGGRNRPWILKGIGHIANLDALLACYPKATLVHIHREPRDAMPSVAKLATHLWSMKVNRPDPCRVGALQLKWYGEAMRRYLETRHRLNLDERILDVPYAAMRDDPMPAMREIYRRAGRMLSPTAEQAMLQWHLDNEQHQHGRHEYSLEEFGLNGPDIDQTFAAYRQKFGHLFKG